MNRINHAVIVAGGLGTRMKSLNPDLPKEMLPINGLPAIQYAIEEIVSADIANAIIVINKDKEIVKKYFDDVDFAQDLYPQAVSDLERLRNSVSFEFLYQDKPKGEVDAISITEPLIPGRPFAIIYPDGLHLPSGKAMKAICSIYQKFNKNVIALSKVTSENFFSTGNTGRVNLKNISKRLFKITTFLPKASGHFQPRYKHEYRTCGYMISKPEIFEYIRLIRPTISDEFNDIHLRSEMIKQHDFLGYYPGTIFYDIGNPAGYIDCLKYIKGNQ